MGQFNYSTDVALAGDETLYVADGYGARVQVSAPDGSFLMSFGSRGNGRGEFEYLVAVAVAADGTVFVADFGNNRIQKWRQR